MCHFKTQNSKIFSPTEPRKNVFLSPRCGSWCPCRTKKQSSNNKSNHGINSIQSKWQFTEYVVYNILSSFQWKCCFLKSLSCKITSVSLTVIISSEMSNKHTLAETMHNCRNKLGYHFCPNTNMDNKKLSSVLMLKCNLRKIKGDKVEHTRVIQKRFQPQHIRQQYYPQAIHQWNVILYWLIWVYCKYDVIVIYDVIQH